MNYKISFQERAKLAIEMLSKQLPITLDDAKKQVAWLQQISISKQKKQRD